MIVNEKGAFDIRQANSGDREYILNSWLLAYENSPEMRNPGIIRDDYFAYTHRLLDELISRASKAGSVYVCHQQDASYSIRGFMCAESFKAFPVVHWISVKKQEKKKGVASALLEQFYKDFDIKPGNLLYTFSSKDLRKHRDLADKARERYSIVYHPWFKYTSQEGGWEV
jgi:hypothetical protein